MRIGARLRELRKRKNMTIKEVSEGAGVSPGMISQIERDLTSPTVATLWNIAKVLGISLGSFLDNNSGDNPVVRGEERKRIELEKSGATYELLCPHLDGKLEFMRVEMDPGEIKDPELITHEGEECGVVVQGRLKVILGNEEYILEEGDSICFDCSLPHRYINAGDAVAVSYWAMTPPSFFG